MTHRYYATIEYPDGTEFDLGYNELEELVSFYLFQNWFLGANIIVCDIYAI